MKANHLILLALVLLSGSAARAQITGSTTLTVTSVASAYTSRTDAAAAPETIPTLCSPAPCVMTSSDLNANVSYIRVTDASTSGLGGGGGTVDGSADQRVWNSNTTAFWSGTPSGTAIFWTFNPSTQGVTPVLCTAAVTACANGVLQTFGVSDSADVPFSTISPYVVFGMHGGTIEKMDFSATVGSPSTAPTVTTVFATSSCSGIPTASTGPYVSGDDGDGRFASPLGGGGQDHWTGIYAYDTTQGCRWFDMSTMTAGGAWGPSGNVTLYTDTGTVICSGSGCSAVGSDPENIGSTNYMCSQIHDVRMNRDGRWAYLNNHCSSTSLNSGPQWLWDIATNNVYALGDTGGGVGPYYGGGHTVRGFNNILLNSDTDYASHWLVKRTIPPTSGNAFLLNLFPNQDTHLSWNNQTAGNLQTVIGSQFSTSPPSSAWQDEVTAFSVDGSGTAWRFAHMYTRAHEFNAQGIANVSRDGKWAIFCSDWGGSRDDVFLIPLK